MAEGAVDQVCDSHADCGSLAFACLGKLCSCNPTFGYAGEDCSNPTIVTKVNLIMAVTLFLLSTILLLCALFLMRANGSFEGLFNCVRIFVHSKSKKRIYIIEEDIQMSNPLKRRKHQKMQRKDFCIISVFFFSCISMISYSGLTFDFSLSPSMPYVTKWQPVVTTFFLYSFTITQASLGKAWMETCIMCGCVRMLSKFASHFKRVEAGINILLLMETLGLCAFFLVKGIKSSQDIVVLVSVFFTFSPPFCILFGLLLSKEMLSLEYGHEVTRSAGQRIRNTSIRMIWCYISLMFATIASSLFMYSASWWFVMILLTLMIHISMWCYQLVVLNYLDIQACLFKLPLDKSQPDAPATPCFNSKLKTPEEKPMVLKTHHCITKIK
mmetsp:Transcript_14558/g.19142  ORF Transcript_14558/g.19142 Transcript_14558/m.19142 type:complete len:383 (+) Transcript_14558:83-1231(+)